VEGLSAQEPGFVPAATWMQALADVVAHPHQHRLVLQPVVDLARGVVAGYEALSRFDRPPVADPDRWFAAAGHLGWSGPLEALVLRRALALRPRLAPGRFLSVNVSPALLATPALREVLAGAGDLTGLVLELTEHEPFDDLDALLAALAPWRAAGASVALDDAGTGYSGLRQLAHLRPDLVKLDRSLVSGIDGDLVKQALAESLGAFAGRLDAWLLAEGVERREELDVLAGLGVPLAQGHLLGRPADAPAELGVELACHLLGYADRRAAADGVGALLEPVPAAVGEAEARRLLGSGDVAAVLDEAGLPHGLLVRHASVDLRPLSLRVLPGEDVADVATRAVTRPGDVRFDPVVCVDERGMLLGVVRVERLVTALATRRGAVAIERSLP
jgi:EAL domain-containing protein (putative c-di-GMP-specific phosphodiesterase class I)